MSEWIDVWSYCQLDYKTDTSYIREEKQIIKTFLDVSAKKIRVKFSNIEGVEPIVFSEVTLSVINKDGQGQTCCVKHNGEEKITIRPREEFLSDILNLKIEREDTISINTQLLQNVCISSGSVTYSKKRLSVENWQDNELIPQKELFHMVSANESMTFFYGVSGLSVIPNGAVVKWVAFGDSLTQQGFWVDSLKEQLRKGSDDFVLLNRGIGGNQILNDTDSRDDGSYRHGKAGIKRFERDVFDSQVPEKIIVLHGINDLIHPQIHHELNHVDVQLIEKGLIYYAKTAHEYDAKIYLATLMPLGESIFYEEKLEQLRIKINRWIREQKYFDGVLDLDELAQQKANKHLLREDFGSFDGLHLREKGGEIVAEYVYQQLEN